MFEMFDAPLHWYRWIHVLSEVPHDGDFSSLFYTSNAEHKSLLVPVGARGWKPYGKC